MFYETSINNDCLVVMVILNTIFRGSHRRTNLAGRGLGEVVATEINCTSFVIDFGRGTSAR